MRTLIGLIAFLILALPMSAQEPIDIDKVPAKVLRTFERKNSKATEITWTNDGGNYVVDFTDMRGQIQQITYDENGKWMESKTFYEEKELPSKVRDYVRKEYGNLKFKQAYYIQDAAREKKYVILLTDKIRGFDDPFTWEVWLNAAGRHITTFEPDIPDLETGTDLPPDERFQGKVDKNVDDLAGAAADESIDKKDLPSITLNWLKNNYDYEWNYKEILIRDDRKLGTVYYVVMKRQGYPDTWEHYFDFNGKFIKKTRIDDGE